MTEASLDFSLEAEPVQADGGAEKPAAEDSLLDFNLGFDASESEAESSPSEAAASTKDAAALGLESRQGSDKQDNEISFDMDFGAKAHEPDLAASAASTSEAEVPGTAETIQFDVPAFSETLPNLELPELNIAEETSQAAASESDFLDLTGLADDAKTLSITEPEPPKETAREASSDLDFNFDLGNSEETTTETSEINIESVLEPEDSGANSLEMDLSGISLDLDASGTSGTVEQTSDAEDELEEVNTKLDLVTAYMDMGDAEGARELLDEVLKEGGAKQRERAQALLNSLA